jgi:hypothetical protein
MNCCRVVPGTDSGLTEAFGQPHIANVETTPYKTVTNPFLPHPFRFTIQSPCILSELRHFITLFKDASSTA